MIAKGSFREGYRFGLGITLAQAECDLAEAIVEADFAVPGQDQEYANKQVRIKNQVLKRLEDLVKAKTS